MRSLVVACVVVVGLALLMGTAANAAAPAQQSQVSNEMLTAMGMGGMQRISDAQGEQIRGKWFIVAVNFIWAPGAKFSYFEQTINIGNIGNKVSGSSHHKY
jgi:hypothetical protein